MTIIARNEQNSGKSKNYINENVIYKTDTY